jgi:hypothetical protein
MFVENVVVLGHNEAVLLQGSSLQGGLIVQSRPHGKDHCRAISAKLAGVEHCGQTEGRYRSAMPSAFDAFAKRCNHRPVAICFIGEETIFPHATFSTTVYLAPRRLSCGHESILENPLIPGSHVALRAMLHNQMHLSSRTSLCCLRSKPTQTRVGSDKKL